jgi:hypothetical protein
MPIERRTGVCTVANAEVIRKPSVLPSLPSRNRVVGSEKRDSERIVGTSYLGITSGLPVIQPKSR